MSEPPIGWADDVEAPDTSTVWHRWMLTSREARLQILQRLRP